MKLAGYRQTAMLQPLEREFLQLSDRDFDRTLSLEVLAALVGAYSEDELEHFSTLISAFVKERRSVIAALYEANRNNEYVHPLLFQPEAIAILERLENAAARLRASWDTVMPSRLLDSLSEALNRPV